MNDITLFLFCIIALLTALIVLLLIIYLFGYVYFTIRNKYREVTGFLDDYHSENYW